MQAYCVECRTKKEMKNSRDYKPSHVTCFNIVNQEGYYSNNGESGQIVGS